MSIYNDLAKVYNYETLPQGDSKKKRKKRKVKTISPIILESTTSDSLVQEFRELKEIMTIGPIPEPRRDISDAIQTIVIAGGINWFWDVLSGPSHFSGLRED